MAFAQPQEQLGLYDPAAERGACGVALLANVAAQPSHALVREGLVALERMEHRGARGSDESSGDGAGILVGTPQRFLRQVRTVQIRPIGSGCES